MFFYDYYFFFFADGLQQTWLCLQVREEAVCLAIPAGGTDSRHVRRTKYDSLQTISRGPGSTEPSTWTVYRMAVRTNNDVKGWHHRINSPAYYSTF